MKAFIFPGQGAQYPGMGKDLYDTFEAARSMFEEADEILGFNITKLMFEGSQEDLRQTRVTQPAIFLHSVILASTIEDFVPTCFVDSQGNVPDRRGLEEDINYGDTCLHFATPLQQDVHKRCPGRIERDQADRKPHDNGELAVATFSKHR